MNESGETKWLKSIPQARPMKSWEQIDGVDFKKRIWLIYQECHIEAEISAAFKKLQNDLWGEISARLDDVKEQILYTFEIDMQKLLKLAKIINGKNWLYWAKGETSYESGFNEKTI